MHLNEYFDRIFCIHISSKEDRRKHIEKEASRFGLYIEFFEASIPQEITLPVELGNANKYEYACATSHIRLLRKIAEGNDEKVLILEDDVEFSNDLHLRFDSSIIPNFDMLYFGINYANSTYTQIDDNFSKVSYAYTTHAYAVTKSSAKKILQFINENNLNKLKEPIDVLYAKLMCNKENNVFVYNNPLAFQKNGHSEILLHDINYDEHLRPNGTSGTKIDLKDVTFIIPVKYDNEHRIKNLQTVLLYIGEYFDTNIIVIESNGIKIHKEIASLIGSLNIQYMNKTYLDNGFCKMQMINDAFKTITTPYFVIHDCDVLIPHDQYLKTVDILRNNNAELLLPFDDFTKEISPSIRSKILKLRTINWIKDEECNVTNETFIAPGGVCMMRSVAFKFIGLGNEFFRSWGPEDQELIERMKKLGGRTGRIDGKIYHLYHTRNEMNSEKHPAYEQNLKEFEKIKTMSQQQLIEYIKSWPWKV